MAMTIAKIQFHDHLIAQSSFKGQKIEFLIFLMNHRALMRNA